MKKEKQIFHGLNEYNRYAVLIPWVRTNKGKALLLQKRSASLKTQPGDLCFPGGRIKEGEEPSAAAVRETIEELLVRKNQIGKLKELPVQIGPDGGLVYPFYAELKNYNNTFSAREVETVALLPAEVLRKTRPMKHEAVLVTKPGPDFPYDLVEGDRERIFAEKKIVYYFYRTAAGTVWGLTANILRDYLEADR